MDSTIHQTQDWDAVVIGSGIGGLLAAARLCQLGRRILVLERLSFIGGRFTSIPFKGTQVSTGAAHLIPHGSNGAFGQMLRSLGLARSIYNSDVFGSFHVGGKHFICKRFSDILSLFSMWEKLQLLRMMVDVKFRNVSPEELSFEQWIRNHTQCDKILRVFERFANFALSASTSDISYNEGRRIIKSVRNLGFPGIPEGGCGAIANDLAAYIQRHGGMIWTHMEASEILVENGVATGVRALDRKTGAEVTVLGKVIISDAGPVQTDALLDYGLSSQKARNLEEARGLRIQFLSCVPLIEHRGIMFCLDTQRVAGIVQPTNADPKLAPPGKHLLITHQILKGDNLEMEADLALGDLKDIFGRRFQEDCEILCIQTFSGTWPVNRAVQGRDVGSEGSVRRLYLVGDGCKPPGYIMVEGVAKGVDDVIQLIKARQEV